MFSIYSELWTKYHSSVQAYCHAGVHTYATVHRPDRGRGKGRQNDDDRSRSRDRSTGGREHSADSQKMRERRGVSGAPDDGSQVRNFGCGAQN